MPLFTYKAKTSTGITSTGVLEAKTKAELARLLKIKGLLLLSASTSKTREKTKSSLLSLRIPGLGSGVSVSDKMMFSRNLAVMLDAGVPITRALSTLSKQSENKVLQSAITNIVLRIRKGSTLAKALEVYKGIFGELYINMIAAGEESGTVNDVLNILAEQLRKDHELRSRVRGALVYPMVILASMTIIGTLMLIFVIPTLQAVFDDLGAELPITTKIILGIGNGLASYWWIIFPAFLGGIYGLYLLIKTPPGKRLYDSFIIHAPVLGGISKKVYTARFSRTLASLIKGGVPILEALQVVSSIMGNHYYKNSLKAAQEGVRKGEPLFRVLGGYSNLYTPLIIQMLEVGEETGKLADILERLAVFYEEEVNQITKNLSSIIEPILMLIIGAAVGFFAISMIQPIYNVIGNV